MRGLVIGRMRTRHAQERGGGLVITSLDARRAEQAAGLEFPQALGDALDDLARLDPELAHVVDLKFVCGFSSAEIDTLPGVSERTAQRQWQKARLLCQALGPH